jgi:hypothetical protein
MRVSWLAVAALLASCLASVPSTEAAAGVTIDLVDAVSQGCSTDTVTDPDLRVTVRLDGAVVLQDAASDLEQPLYAHAVAVPTPDHAATLTVQVEEAEPGGFFGFGTSYIPCDVAAGAGDVFTTTWSGEARTLTLQGDAGNSAKVVVVLGPGAPAAPQVLVSGITAHGATVAWDSTTGATGHDLAPTRFGAPLRPLSAAAGTTALDGLCDGQPHEVRVVRHADPWSVASVDVRFTTLNDAPAPPRILSASLSGSTLSLAWEEPTAHDVTAYGIHAGADPGFSPTPANRVASDTPFASWRDQSGQFPWNGSGYVKVVATDAGGLSAASPAFHVGDPAVSKTLSGREECGPLAVSATSSSQSTSSAPGGSTTTTAPPQGAAGTTTSPPQGSTQSTGTTSPPLQGSTRAGGLTTLPPGGQDGVDDPVSGDPGQRPRPFHPGNSPVTPDDPALPLPVVFVGVAVLLAGGLLAGILLVSRR